MLSIMLLDHINKNHQDNFLKICAHCSLILYSFFIWVLMIIFHTQKRKIYNTLYQINNWQGSKESSDGKKKEV